MTPVLQVQFGAGNEVLSFRAEEPGLCSCHLQTDIGQLFLGRHVWTTLVSRFERVLQSRADTAVGMLETMPVWWVLSLDTHYTLYVAYPDDENLQFFWQDRDLLVTNTMSVNRAQWRDLLERLRAAA